MKSTSKSKIIILISLGILFALSSMITVNLSFIAGNNNKSSEYSADNNLDKENLKLSKISERIHIINNSGWVAFKDAGNCTGEGTYSDPYVIEDLEINGGGSGSGIWIENSSVYFRIENCSVSYANAGIQLSNVNNSLIITNNCSSNYYGIYLYDSNNNTISGNTANNNGYGTYLYDSNNNTISGNTANDNWNGISVNFLQMISVSGNNNIISGNTVNNNENGIYLSNSNYSTISGNTANDNTYIGIVIIGNNNIISENNAINNSGGILNSAGIVLHGNNNTISGNTANDNTDYGIYISESNNNTILRNTANNNNYGIYLEEASDNNNITENIINYNYLIGIYLDSSNGNMIYFNCFNNYLNAFDDGSFNNWDNGIKGNYWSDYTGSDADGDGIGDVPYKITGSAGSQDNFPLMKCPFSAQDGGRIPIELIILISVISGAAVIGVVTIFLIRHKRKRI